MISSDRVNYRFDLQKNGNKLLHPSPQILGIIQTPGSGTAYNSAAGSVIVPLSKKDKVSLLVTIDGAEGDFGGVQIESAQISAHMISEGSYDKYHNHDK